MFDKANHIHTLATVIGTMGGFQAQPDWFKSLAKTSLWQILMSSIFIYQGGGNLDIVYSIVVAVVFYILIYLSGYININVPSNLIDSSPYQEITEQEAESFLAYN